MKLTLVICNNNRFLRYKIYDNIVIYFIFFTFNVPLKYN